jgi:hypothetical protein
MGVIEEVEHSDVQYLSPIFTVPKKDGEYRMVLNLKDSNLDIQYYHFKMEMETFETALKLIKLNSYMASIDIRHAYYSVPIAVEHKQFLCFKWKVICYITNLTYIKGVYGRRILRPLLKFFELE